MNNMNPQVLVKAPEAAYTQRWEFRHFHKGALISHMGELSPHTLAITYIGPIVSDTQVTCRTSKSFKKQRDTSA